MIWESEVIERAKSMWAAGNSASTIAKALRLTRGAVLGKAFRGNWPREKVKIWTPKITKTAKRMWAAGCSASIIAKAFDITSGAVLAKASREKWSRPLNVKIQRVKYGSLSEQSGRTP